MVNSKIITVSNKIYMFAESLKEEYHLTDEEIKEALSEAIGGF